MYDFEIDCIEDLLDFIERNRDLQLKKDRNIIYFATTEWSYQSVKDGLQMIQNRPAWDWDAVRSQIMTYFCYHQAEAYNVRTALLNAKGDRPVVVCRLINLSRSLAQIEKKYRS